MFPSIFPFSNTTTGQDLSIDTAWCLHFFSNIWMFHPRRPKKCAAVFWERHQHVRCKLSDSIRWLITNSMHDCLMIENWLMDWVIGIGEFSTYAPVIERHITLSPWDTSYCHQLIQLQLHHPKLVFSRASRTLLAFQRMWLRRGSKASSSGGGGGLWSPKPTSSICEIYSAEIFESEVKIELFHLFHMFVP